jgi:dephospho-CoA kinase
MGLKIGITGGIACGKSLVGKYLQAQGLAVIDADHLVHQAYATNQEVHQALRDQFGSATFTAEGSPDRKWLAQRAFADSGSRVFLEQLLHPIVRHRIDHFFEEHQQARASFALIPLLYETGTENRYDRVWCIACDEAIQRERLATHRGLSETAIDRRLASQWPIAEKVKRADLTIWNNETPHALEQALNHAIETLFP